MILRFHPISAVIFGGIVFGAACSAVTPRGGGFQEASSTSGSAGSSGTRGAGGAQASGQSTGESAGSGLGGNVNFVTVSASSGSVMSTGSGVACNVTDMNADMDKDGWTPAQGDCNDCDPNVNPGAIDVAGDPNMVDSDCDGKYDPPTTCDTGLTLTDVNAADAAKAIELCQTTTETPATPKQKTWGVISAAYVRANGDALSSPGSQVGIQSGWGTNVHVQGGSNMIALSSGDARTTGQPNACGSNSCEMDGPGTPPANFPQDNPSCPPSLDIFDDVALELKVRAPTNATGFSFKFKFYSMEYPYWVCDSYNDQFIALVSPAPTGSINGNISFDSKNNPVSVNLGFFNVCDPTQSGKYASDCKQNGGSCPSPPSPYCPSGTAELAGTGFDAWDKQTGGAGATSWLSSQAPVTGGEEITIRFAIWDTGDDNYDSTVLIDDFQWIATKGTVAVGTTMVPNPQ